MDERPAASLRVDHILTTHFTHTHQRDLTTPASTANRFDLVYSFEDTLS